MIRRTVGALLILLIFAGLVALYAAEVGWRQAIVTWVLGCLLALALMCGVWLLEGGGR